MCRLAGYRVKNGTFDNRPAWMKYGPNGQQAHFQPGDGSHLSLAFNVSFMAAAGAEQARANANDWKRWGNLEALVETWAADVRFFFHGTAGQRHEMLRGRSATKQEPTFAANTSADGFDYVNLTCVPEIAAFYAVARERRYGSLGYVAAIRRRDIEGLRVNPLTVRAAMSVKDHPGRPNLWVQETYGHAAWVLTVAPYFLCDSAIVPHAIDHLSGFAGGEGGTTLSF